MIDHVMLMVSDKAKSQDFYRATLDALGYSLIHQSPEIAGFGLKGHVPFWLKQGHAGRVTHSLHIAFAAKTRAMVSEFYKIALENGAKSNGSPGIRPEHGESYFAAYVLDADGHNIEAVCYAKDSQ